MAALSRTRVPSASRHAPPGGMAGSVRGMTATDRAAAAQPLWALVAPRDRARYLRRAAMAVLDELDAARRPARRRGRPAAQRGDARRAAPVGRRAARPRERRARARSPTGGSGRSPRCAPGAAPRSSRRRWASSASTCATARPWAGPLLEVAAALLAGNARAARPAAPRAAARMQNAFVRAGLPEELFQLVGEDELEPAARVVTLDPPAAKGTMLVLDGAPLDRVVDGAVWAAFAGGGRRHAAVGRAIAVRPQALALAAGIEAAARRLRVGDPRRPDTEVGPLASAADRDRVEELVAAAEAAGATRLCGGADRRPRRRRRVLRPRGAARRAARRRAAARAGARARPRARRGRERGGRDRAGRRARRHALGLDRRRCRTASAWPARSARTSHGSTSTASRRRPPPVRLAAASASRAPAQLAVAAGAACALRAALRSAASEPDRRAWLRAAARTARGPRARAASLPATRARDVDRRHACAFSGQADQHQHRMRRDRARRARA